VYFSSIINHDNPVTHSGSAAVHMGLAWHRLYRQLTWHLALWLAVSAACPNCGRTATQQGSSGCNDCSKLMLHQLARKLVRELSAPNVTNTTST
jgi:tRNA(Ile2) C34 agmatinyltransferase TiaS